MKKIHFAILAVGLICIATACTKTKHLHSSNVATIQQQPVNLTQSYVNTAADYSYKYPDGYSISTEISYGKFSVVNASTVNTDVQNDKNTQLVFVVNKVDMSSLTEQSIVARIKAEYLSQKNSVVSQVKIGNLNSFEVSDDVSADDITSDRYFVQSPNGSIFELLAVKNNSVATAILNSFSFVQK